MVQPLGALNEDGEAGMRRFAGSYFVKQLAWFDATYPVLQGRMRDMVAERNRVFASSVETLTAPGGQRDPSSPA
jgi:hypothetical protein